MKKTLIPVLVVLICILCSNPADTNIQWNDPDFKTSLRESYSVYLTGKIMDESGKPLAGAVVGLNTRKLADTTGTDGSYALIEKKKAGKLSYLGKIAEDSIYDSIEVLQEGQIITSMIVSDLIDSLPDIFIVQRDIYGKLKDADSSVAIIRANLRDKGVADSVSRMINLWFNKENKSFSGFIYFANSASSKDYDVVIYVMNKDSIITGTSKIITFPSTAGDIEIPEFSCKNAFPVITYSQDTTVDINDTISLHVSATDMLYGIKGYIWALDGVNFSDTTDSGSICGVSFAISGLHVVLVKVFNNKNFFSIEDSLKINVVAIPPVVTSLTDTSIGMFDTVALRANATDNGTVMKYVWAVDGIHFMDTTVDGVLKTSFPDLKVRYTVSGYAYLDSLKPGAPQIDKNYNRFINLYVPVKVLDNDNIESSPDTCHVKVTLVIPVISLTGPPEAKIGDTLVYRASSPVTGAFCRYIWARDGTNFSDTTTSDTLVMVYQSTKTITVAVKGVTSTGIITMRTSTGTSFSNSNPGGTHLYPTVTISTPVVAYVNDTVTVTATGKDDGSIVNYIWAIDDGAFSDTTVTATFSTKFSTSGTHTIYVKVIDNDKMVSVNSAICNVIVQKGSGRTCAAKILNSDTTVTIRNNIRFSAKVENDSGVTVLKYLWSTRKNTFLVNEYTDSIGNSLTTSFSDTGTVKILVRCLMSDSVYSSTDTCTVRVRYQIPVVNILTPDTTVTSFDTATFRASAVDDGNVLKYDWSVQCNSSKAPPLKLAGIDSSSIRAVFQSGGTGYVIVRVLDNDYCWSKPDTCKVQLVCKKPRIELLTHDTTVEILDTVIFKVKGSDLSRNVKYEWNARLNNNINLQTLSTSIDSFAVFLSTDGIVYVTVKAINIDCDMLESETDTCVVNVMKNAPVITLFNHDTTVEIYDTIAFMIAATDNGSINKFCWTDSMGSLSGGRLISQQRRGDTSLVFISFSSMGKKYVSCAVYDDKMMYSTALCTVTVAATPPVLTLTPTDTTVAINDTITFKVTAVDNDSTVIFMWDPNPMFADLISNTIESKTAEYTFKLSHAGNTTFRCRVKDLHNNESVISCTVNVLRMEPVLTSLTKDTVIEVNDTITLKAVALDNDTVTGFSWYSAGNLVSYDKQGDSCFVRFTFNSVGKFPVRCYAVDNNNFSSNVDTCIVTTISNPPTVTMLTPDTTVDINDIVTFKAFATDTRGVTGYTWFTRHADAGSFVLPQPLRNNNGEADFRFQNEGKLYVIVTAFDNNHEESVPDTCVVTVVKNPPVLAIQTPDTTVNIFDTVTIRCSAADNGSINRFEWESSMGSIVSKIDSLGTSVIRIKTAGYNRIFVTCRAYDDDGLLSNTDTCILTVTGNRPTVTMLTNDTTVDINNFMVFRATATDDGVVMRYSWSKRDGNILTTTSSTDGHYQFSFATEGTAYVTVVAYDNDNEWSLPETCVVTVTKQIPAVTMLTPDTTVSVNDSITFRASAVDNGTVHYNWNSNVNTVTGEYKTVFSSTGEQYVVVRAIDEDNLISEADTCRVNVVDP